MFFLDNLRFPDFVTCFKMSVLDILDIVWIILDFLGFLDILNC